MSLAMESKKLCEDIIASHSMREKNLGRLFGDVHKTIKNFSSDRMKMGAAQKNDLSKFVSGLSKDVTGMIGNFHKDRHEMAKNLKQDFSDFRDSLNDNEIARLKDFKAMIGDIRKGIKNMQKDMKEFKKQVQNKLVEFSGDHADMSKQLRKELSNYVSGIVNETGMMMKGYKHDRKGMATNLKEMNAVLSGKKGLHSAPEAKAEAKPKMEANSASNVMQKAKHGKKAKKETRKN